MSRIFTISLFLLLLPALAGAVETAPRISDREILEGLAALNTRYAELKGEIQTVMAEMKAEFKRIDARFEAVDQRFEAIDHRFATLEKLILTLFGSLIMLIVALFAYIAWDRRTVVKPLEQKLDVVEEKITRLDRDLQRDFDISSPEGSKLTRLIQVLAGRDQPLAAALKNASLL